MRLISFAFTAPAGWRALDLTRDPEAAIDAAVAEAFSGRDRDSSATEKHWMRQRLRAATSAPDEVGATVVAAMYPTRAVAGEVLPVSGTVLRYEPGVMPQDDDAMRALAALASRDSTARPVPAAGALGLRTHSLRDLSAAFTAEIESAPLGAEDRAQITNAAPERLMALRAHYAVPPGLSSHWHGVVLTAMIPAHESAVAELFLELFDAFVEAARWVEGS